MDSNNNQTFLAIALSIMVLIAWQFFYVSPKFEKEQRIAEQQAQQEAAANNTASDGNNSANLPSTENQSGNSAVPSSESGSQTLDRDQAISADKRVELETSLLVGSINLKGGRIDDLRLQQYRETIDPDSPLIELLSPKGTKEAYFAEFGFLGNDVSGEVPGPTTQWNAASGARLSENGSVLLDWTNEKGVRFEREISVDDGYMFTIRDSIVNKASDTIELTPYGRIARFGKPVTANIFVLHEGLIGVFGEEGLKEIDYDDLEDDGDVALPRVDTGWLGITDKYWATALIPGQSFKARFTYSDKGKALYQTDYLGEALSITSGNSVSVENRLFAGAKKTVLIDQYDEDLNLDRFELMIDWGWFHFITKPLFSLLSWLYELVGNFGVAILIATVIVKAVFLPLANMSYASMAKMKKVQPEMMTIKERFGDDKAKQQQEMMALYKREKINPAAGCWPILVQIPVFFALYKVLFVTIEMRQAPFFGWIQDLAAPDPSSLWNLFGLLPWEPAAFLPAIVLLGVWPLLMGITMFMQMQMNPAPPDPTQAMIFKWMPVVFTFMLSTFPAGLVIYWAWNNFLSIIQQGIIMKRHGTKIELWDNLTGMFARRKSDDGSTDRQDDKSKK